ncbi:MAG: glycosyltransferase [Bacteroidetes bacterium]|nr:glycosyltransferase [Bacteroidota bacterium]
MVILTNNFPDTEKKSEIWLLDELNIIYTYFNKIYLIPDIDVKGSYKLPSNVEVIETNNSENISLIDKWNCFKVLMSDCKYYPSKIHFFKNLRYNFALLKSIQSKANNINVKLNKIENNIILYSYWSDNLATKASLIKLKNKNIINFISRGHGFDVFENQTHFGVIPFRKFQYTQLNKIYSVSKKGLNHLNANRRYNETKNSYSYLGTLNNSFKNIFNYNNTFSILTCSFIRNVKRLDLMPEILKHINFELIWHVIGNGEDFDLLKEKCKVLPKNISVIFHGELSNHEVLNFYQNNSINLFASLSFSEGLPVSMMEAQSFGIPIMSTDVGGCSEICNNETGFLIDKNFVAKDVAEKIEKFKSSNKNTITFHNQCRKHWEENFDAEKNYKQFAESILNLN